MAGGDDGAGPSDLVPVEPSPSASPSRSSHRDLEVEALAVRAEVLVANQSPEAREWATDRGRLRRFLQGHGRNAERALASLRWCLDQRMQLQLWHIDLEEVREELELGKVYCRSLDRDRHPVVVYRNCRADHTLDLTMRLRAFVLVLDYLEVCLDRGDFGECATWVVILDLGGKPARGTMTFEYLSRLIKLFMKCYPTRLHRCFIVDANMLMNAFWSAACKILEADTIRKVVFVRRAWDEEGRCHIPQLVEQIGSEELEEEYGGRDGFQWDPARHWQVLDLVPRQGHPLPLIEAARVAAMESGNAEGLPADAASCAGDSVGHSAGASEGRWFDAISEEPSVTPLDCVVRDCRALHKQLATGSPAADLDPRVARLRGELARFVQDWDAGVGAAMEQDWHHSSAYHYGDHEKDPLQQHALALQDSPSAASSAATAAAAASAAAVSAVAASSDARLKTLLLLSASTLLLMVIMFSLWIVRLSDPW